MSLSLQVVIWNRAALEAGGSDPREGDTALSALLLLHGMVMNGGVDHALEALNEAQYRSAVEGFRYFGLEEAAAVLEEAKDATELQLEQYTVQYGAIVPDDSTLTHAFQLKLLSSPQDFADAAV